MKLYISTSILFSIIFNSIILTLAFYLFSEDTELVLHCIIKI